MPLPHYPKIFTLGHDAIQNLFKGTVEITEKVDGSMFGFGVDQSGEVVMRSKGRQIYFESCDKMFEQAAIEVESRRDKLMAIHESIGPFFVYGEYLNKPKHNVLAYERTPKYNIIVFGVKIGQNFVKSYEVIKEYADNLGFETVPLIYNGEWEQSKGYERFIDILEITQSVLGNTLIEGVVIKNYGQLTTIGEITSCFGKYVSEKFKEKHMKDWKHISGKDTLGNFIEGFRTEARWNKAIQHLRDEGKLTFTPKDIGMLMKELHVDLEKEEKVTIEKFLSKYFMPQIKRKICAGFPEFYKQILAKKQFVILDMLKEKTKEGL
ncbi:MAG: hypothetical protein E2O29_01600 [Deltaproteobacteria bacterium]|nr:MAG: hypothetical protein E2O29_01600 [Deltaproteobacteria bacterium]